MSGYKRRSPTVKTDVSCVSNSGSNPLDVTANEGDVAQLVERRFVEPKAARSNRVIFDQKEDEVRSLRPFLVVTVSERQGRHG